MEAILFIIIGAAAGLLIGIFVERSRHSKEREQLASLTADNDRLKDEKTAADQALRAQGENNARLSVQVEALNKAVETISEAHKKQTEDLREGFNSQLGEVKQAHERQVEAMREQIKSERQHAAELRQENDEQWAEKLDKLREEMLKTAAEQLADKQKALQQTNNDQMEQLLKPIKEQFEQFKNSVEDSKTKSEVQTTKLQSTFESTMKLFQQQQQQTVQALSEQTQRIGTDAANLAKALKGDSKMQGDWGEMVLASMLDNSGLTKGVQYIVQENVKDSEGNNYRPDVVVLFPGGRSLVIDSKVSLTSYANAVAADSEESRERLLKEHVRSMRKHVDELAAKDYDELIKQRNGFVLMFVPNEAAYIAAMRKDPSLGQYAYEKRVIIISPSNLNIALRLVYNIWQNDRQNKNVEKIVTAAARLYDKVAGFEDSFAAVGRAIQQLTNSYGSAQNRLYTGKGNIMNQVESLKELGVTPKKKLRNADDLPSVGGQPTATEPQDA